jgi:hypothetical protein
MKPLLFSVVAALLLSAPGAQAASRQELAEKLLNLMKTPQLAQVQVEQIQRVQAQQLARFASTDGQRAQLDKLQLKIGEKINGALGWDAVKADYIALYSEMFTEEELKALVAFYQTPVGQKLVEKSPMLATKCNQVSQVRYDRLMAEIQSMTDDFRARASGP